MGEVVAIGERLGSKDYRAMGLDHIASSLMFLTRFDEAWLKAQEALQLAREIGDREHEAWLLSTTIPVCLFRQGQFDSARSALAEGLEDRGSDPLIGCPDLRQLYLGRDRALAGRL